MELVDLTNSEKNQRDNTTDLYLAPSTTSYSYGKLNKNTDITSKKSLTAKTYSITMLFLEDKISDIIQNKYSSNPYSKDMLFSNISVDIDVQLFETPKKTNSGVTAPRAHIVWVFYDVRSFDTPTMNNHSVISPSALIGLGGYSEQ